MPISLNIVPNCALLLIVNALLFGELTGCFSTLLTVRRCQTDTDPTFVDLEPQAALLVIIGLLAKFREFGCVFKQTLFQLGIMGVDLCDGVFGIIIEAAEERIYITQLHSVLDMAMDTLSAVQESVLRLRYYRGNSMEEIAEQKGVSKQFVAQTEQDALRRIRQQPIIMRELYEFYDLNARVNPGSGLESFKRSGMSQQELIVATNEAQTNMARNLAEAMLQEEITFANSTCSNYFI